MPELPEVETIKNELLPYVVGHRITGVTLLWDGMVHHPSVQEFCYRLPGQLITGVTRRGKYLMFSLSSDNVMVIHLKMSGSLLLKPATAPPVKYTRVIIHLDGESIVLFRDPRKFGAMWLVEDPKPMIAKLGPEPLDGSFTPKFLAQRLDKRTAPIKAILLDQSFVAGIGNMYADEALFSARIHPLRLGRSLSSDEIKRLHRAIKDVLSSGIAGKGASIENYFRPDGTLGKAHYEFRVAHGRNMTCNIHKVSIVRITVRNRGTYFCPICQPET